MAKAQSMRAFGAMVLAEPYGQHFQQPAFVTGAEGVVGLDTVENDHPVGLVGVFVHIHGKAVRPLPHLHHFHAGEDGAARAFFRHAQFVDQGQLPLGGCAAVAAHGRHDEGFGPAFLEGIHNSPDYGSQGCLLYTSRCV